MARISIIFMRINWQNFSDFGRNLEFPRGNPPGYMPRIITAYTFCPNTVFASAKGRKTAEQVNNT